MAKNESGGPPKTRRPHLHPDLGRKSESYTWNAHKEQLELMRMLAKAKGLTYQEYITTAVYRQIREDLVLYERGALKPDTGRAADASAEKTTSDDPES